MQKSWINYTPDTDFPIQNVPFGICQIHKDMPFVATRIADQVISLSQLNEMGLFGELNIDKACFDNEYLNDFIALGKQLTVAVRKRIQYLFDANDPLNIRKKQDQFCYSIEDVEVMMPVYVRDYTDFYSSEDHARNVGTMFRDPENALLPNWKHIPVGYHGRASSITVSGTPVRRPKGQIVPAGSDTPIYAACRLLDFELEVGFVVGKNNELGKPVAIQDAEDHIFGLVLFNDWSARDIQKWEYVPLGPFLAKSFASTISPWVVTLEALEAFRVPGPVQDPEVLPYLKYSGDKHLNVELEVFIQPENGLEHKVSHSNFKYMYWNMAQQLAHHTVNGCNLNIGDLCASGTISGPDKGSYGSMLELSWRGTKPIQMPDGSERKFLLDGDTLILKGYAKGDGYRIGFGSASAKILPTE
jgi:fumarylacetoacetase